MEFDFKAIGIIQSIANQSKYSHNFYKNISWMLPNTFQNLIQDVKDYFIALFFNNFLNHSFLIIEKKSIKNQKF